ncbi:MAG: copper chaperone PCu(A)C [Actinomycetota bacterium]
MRHWWFAGVIVLATAVSCSGGDETIEVVDARLGEPTGPNAALYFTASGGDRPDRLLGARAAVATEVQIHETTTDEDGTMSMRPIDGIDIPADGELVLEPGGYHLMLVDVERVEAGDEIDVTLIWENSEEMTIPVDVVAPADTRSDDA